MLRAVSDSGHGTSPHTLTHRQFLALTRFLLSSDTAAQYSWPPRDPTKDFASRGQPQLDGDPFVYGGEGLNPALMKNHTRVRRRKYVPPWENAVNSDDEVADATGSERSSSSPEPYLSDYDSDDVPLAYHASQSMRVRRGSEGWEVRPAPGWSEGSASWTHDVENGRANPWERPGRYRVYDDDN